MIELVRYHTMQPVPGKPGRYYSQVRVALVKTGHKWLQVLAIDAGYSSGLRIWKVAKEETKYMTPLMRKGKPYSLKNALVTFRRFGKVQGMTKGVKKLLREASKQVKEQDA